MRIRDIDIFVTAIEFLAHGKNYWVVSGPIVTTLALKLPCFPGSIAEETPCGVSAFGLTMLFFAPVLIFRTDFFPNRSFS
jgi:hypothetical protein